MIDSMVCTLIHHDERYLFIIFERIFYSTKSSTSNRLYANKLLGPNITIYKMLRENNIRINEFMVNLSFVS